MEDRPSASAGWWRGRARSFGFAFQGLALCLRTQMNARIHAAAALVAVAFGFWLKIAMWEWCAVVGAIALVWTAETFNTALELMVDLLSPELHPLAGKIKDIAAAAVLLSALGAFAIGTIIFAPKLWALFPY